MKFPIPFIIIGLPLLVIGWAEERPLAQIKYGRLEGITLPVKETSKTADAFFGIPFAKPPVGPLRFKYPEPPEPWESVRDASKYPLSCLQNLAIMDGFSSVFKSSFQMPPVSEDCLYLNVFTPSNRRPDSKLPVMFYIHGGGLLVGGASMNDGSALSAYENVVVVSIQYRLGIMGFLSTEDDKLPGNLGLMDQVAALHWVKENIADFGGDPQSVTIFGESAGAISVSALLLSPLTKGLFHKAIAESGVMLMPSMVANKPEDTRFYREMVSDLFGCNLASLVECIKLKSEDQILDVARRMQFLPFPTNVDGVFLPKPAEKIMAHKEMHRVPLLLGVCKQEFGFMLPQILKLPGTMSGMDRSTVQQALSGLHLLSLTPKMLPPILDEYLTGVSDPFEYRNRFLDICGDIVFVMPSLRTAKYHRDSGAPVYFYEFQHRPSLFDGVKPDFVKADHVDETIYVFGGPFLRDGVLLAGNATAEEKALSRTIMAYWANFARTGDPNGPGLAEWPRYTKEERYLEIDLKQKASARLKKDKYKFWTETLPMRMEMGDHTEL
ncbi:fatty acyl-CoA hydrolase precursor, medium chain-like [Hyperolius riggenbachi]|uniref:fatty acyl-CoA hydrolase precursor, medium chain-like n=1 Tax=Hyperolius riggenbachi TaxID=752182 RepID=UPI0035A33C1C